MPALMPDSPCLSQQSLISGAMPGIEHDSKSYDVLLEEVILSDIEMQLAPVIVRKTPERLSHDLACPGFILKWSVGSIYNNYPWQRHFLQPHTMGYYFSGVKNKGTEFWVQSYRCTGISETGNRPCFPCQAAETSDFLRELQNRANEVNKHANFIYYTYEQLVVHLRETTRKLTDLRLKVCYVF